MRSTFDAEDASQTEPLLDDETAVASIEPTPLPQKVMAVVGIVIFSEPVALVLLYPFLVQIIEHFMPDIDRREFGLYAGLIGASFSVAQFFTTFAWSQLSDKIGRRPVILIGLLGNVITSLWYFSPD